MENAGSIFSFESGMANTLHNNGRKRELSGSNLRAIPNNGVNHTKNYFSTIVNWFKTLENKMAEAKLGWLILAHILGTGVYGYALYIEWGTVKGTILTVLGILYAIIQVARFAIKMMKEVYELKKQVRDFNEPPEVHRTKPAKHA